jgi:hypothetical protein
LPNDLRAMARVGPCRLIYEDCGTSPRGGQMIWRKSREAIMEHHSVDRPRRRGVAKIQWLRDGAAGKHEHRGRDVGCGEAVVHMIAVRGVPPKSETSFPESFTATLHCAIPLTVVTRTPWTKSTHLLTSSHLRFKMRGRHMSPFNRRSQEQPPENVSLPFHALIGFEQRQATLLEAGPERLLRRAR